jgi:hypothetical protein
MLKTIVRQSPQLVSFLLALHLTLSKPQMRHLTQLVDGLITNEHRKTLSEIYRQYLIDLDPKAAADFHRESPWSAADVSAQRSRWMLTRMLELARHMNLPPIMWVSVDDSLGKKDKATRHQEAVAFHHNHTESTRGKQVYSNGDVYVEVHVELGLFGFTWDTRLYLREKTVRKLNRQRGATQPHLRYRSKYHLARERLTALAAALPEGYQVYVEFDSWYASAKLIKYCRRQRWHVICAIKSNRRLNGKRVDQHDHALKHQRYQPIELPAADTPRPRRYFVRTLCGQLEGVRERVCVLISRRHPGDQRPKYFLCTDLTLSAQETLRYYQRRWPVEVDNFYLKEALGLSDFRVQSWEATEKWFAVVLVALNYLQFQQAQHIAQTRARPSLADVIRQHRREHSQALLRFVAEQVLKTRDIETVLQPFIARDRPAIT